MEIEHFFTCPYCWQRISFVIDLTAGEQIYVEDCEVCCRPIRVRFSVHGGELADFDADTIDE